MSDETFMKLLGKTCDSVRLVPALVSAFLVGLLLLFYRELSENVKLFLIPSLVVYSMGAALIGTFHRILGFYWETKKFNERKKTDKEAKQNISNEFDIPLGWRFGVGGIHLILLAAFILYNFCRGSL
jgi:hypothetical protein